MPEYSNLQDTAYYVFDTRVFRQRIRHVRQLLGPEMTLAYAIKEARKGQPGSILVCLSGRGDKDIDYIQEHYGFGEQYDF